MADRLPSLGCGLFSRKRKVIFSYDDIDAEPTAKSVVQINAYLLDADSILLEKRRGPISPIFKEMVYGSKPTDGGHLILTKEEAEAVRLTDKVAAKYIRRLLGAEEFISNTERYCFWLVDSTAEERGASKVLKERIARVRDMRLSSDKKQTRELADYAYLFGEIRHTKNSYVLIPLHTSENRRYIPFGFFGAEVICTNANSMLQNATLFDFGILTSAIHMAWVRSVCGRIKSDFRYSNKIVYNNFPFPAAVAAALIDGIELAAKSVLDARDTLKNPDIQ